MGLRFEWDARKAARNLAKHGVSFDEATTVFSDPLSLTIRDPDHPDEDERWVIIGETHRRRLVVVVHAEEASTVRIISAREADRHEREKYEERTS
jgi:uncharacterized DUF497 family protein